MAEMQLDARKQAKRNRSPTGHQKRTFQSEGKKAAHKKIQSLLNDWIF